MSKFFQNRTKLILFLALIVMAGVSIWFNKFNIQVEDSNFSRNGASDENSNFYKPPIDAEDEADRFIQKASENYFFHDFVKGAENYRQAISIYESRKDLKKVAKTYESLGDLYKFANNVKEAESNYLKAKSYHIQNEDPIGEGRSLKQVGNLYRDLGQMETASQWYEKSGQAVKNAFPHRELAKIFESIGQFYWKTDNLLLAQENFSQAQETFAAIKDQMGYDHVTRILAMIKKKIKSSQLSPEESQTPPKKL